ncbi:hypothetical protein BDB00DRAFT_785152 [Zychaea mexicana]|uniref:uncharacterized protein n=1 Tax=Zychaea mexicana TaxID=64656 RepID=UPI0022FF3384|nr:uncharacterized protein BDB00DRAFT_785152 [Zychaea mexicana]KAI9497055.1 hypothetical protein BDB00DRAFT_785152 [Zychaea mexicana]
MCVLGALGYRLLDKLYAFTRTRVKLDLGNVKHDTLYTPGVSEKEQQQHGEHRVRIQLPGSPTVISPGSHSSQPHPSAPDAQRHDEHPPPTATVKQSFASSSAAFGLSIFFDIVLLVLIMQIKQDISTIKVHVFENM